MVSGGNAEETRVPGAESATADPRKFTHYLLSETHTQGRAKARFFRGVAGYDEFNWELLRDAMLAQLPDSTVEGRKTNARGGENYLVRMRIQAPGGTVDIHAVWEVHPTTGTTLVTAYPL